MVRPAVRREIVRHLQKVYDVGERRACKATGFHRSSQRYKSRGDPQTELRIRLKDLAASRVRYGYRRLHILLLREGYRLNHKRTYRLYREEGLSIRTKTPKRKREWRYRSGRPEIASANQCWAMDFMSDALFDGRPFGFWRMLEYSSLRVEADIAGALSIIGLMRIKKPACVTHWGGQKFILSGMLHAFSAAILFRRSTKYWKDLFESNFSSAIRSKAS